MTGILSNQLPGRANPPDADNPLGSFKDRTAPGANDGSYLTQTWSNDRDSILQALFIASGLTPNGIEDTGTASQLFDALVNNRWSSIGNYSVGTIVVGSDGEQYKAVANSGRDSTVVNPATKTDRNFWVKLPYETVVSGDVTAEIYPNGDIIQYGFTPDNPGGVINVGLAVPFSSVFTSITGSQRGVTLEPNAVAFLPSTLSSFDYRVEPSTGSISSFFVARGR